MPENQEAEKKDTGQEDSKAKAQAFMSPGAMSEWAEEANIFVDEEAPPDKPPEAEKEPEGDDKSNKKSADPKATDADKSGESENASPKEEGSQVDERHTERSKTLEERERTLNEKEEALAQKLDQLNEVLSREGQGQQQAADGSQPAGEQPQEDNIDLDEIDDPAARNTVKSLLSEIGGLKRQIKTFEKFSQRQQYDEVRKGLEATVSQARKDFPFEDTIDKKTGRNVAMDAVANIVAIEAQKDQVALKKDKNYKVRNLTDLFSHAARSVQALQGSAKADTKSEPVTAEGILKNHPDIAKEIGEAYLANYQKEQAEEGAPVPRGTSREASIEALQKQQNKRKNSGSLRDRLDAAMEDPEIYNALKKATAKR